MLADGGEQFRLFDCVNAEVRLHVEVEFQHILGIAGLLGYHGKDVFLNGVLADGGRLGGWAAGLLDCRSGNLCRRSRLAAWRPGGRGDRRSYSDGFFYRGRPDAGRFLVFNA